MRGVQQKKRAWETGSFFVCFIFNVRWKEKCYDTKGDIHKYVEK